ncbi:serine/threonine protein kinase [Hyalangium gracile]|uniref:serine/threonine protein kinase n=1 Tax=Hyalangium gracile TaxID=394092 RepID=UPI001CC9F8C1|nr:serine/threonine-protein kinase [Hyalangium gracile]
MTLPAGTQIGKYVVQKKLAEGGMAEIYLATSQGAEGFEKEVVIKRIRSFLASDPGFVDMFIAEARLASRLNHGNVVQIFDFAKHEDTYYLAMEYVRGCTLWDLRKKCKDLMEPMPPVLVAHIGAEVARGLHYAHRLKVNGEPLFLVHRDVTPHNVLISFDGAVKLTDFGIAKAGNKLTSPGMLKGKFAYMSPEQSRGENVDARTDVFALGIVLWEMLTGGRLFDGDSELAVLRAVQQSVIAHPSRLNPDVPEELGDVVMKALEREPDARHQTAGELERALVQCVLNHAQSPDDTDVSAFVRRVYIGVVPSALALPAIAERTQAGDGQQPSSEAAPREPTAVLPGPQGRRNSKPVMPAVSPDEDVNAPTHLLPNRGESSEGRDSSRATTPGRSLASVQGRGPTPSAAPQEQQAEPVYPATVSLPVPAAPAPAAPAPASSDRSKRVGVVMGAVGLALLAVVGVIKLVPSRGQGTEPGAGASQNPGIAGMGDPGTPPVVATPPSPAVMDAGAVAEAPQGSSDGGTAGDAGALAVAPPVGTPPGPSGKVEAPPVAAQAVAMGTLVVRAVPYATVVLNGKSYGEVQGQKAFPLTPGDYQLVFRHPQGSKSYAITIEPNGTVRREFRASR